MILVAIVCAGLGIFGFGVAFLLQQRARNLLERKCLCIH